MNYLRIAILCCFACIGFLIAIVICNKHFFNVAKPGCEVVLRFCVERPMQPKERGGQARRRNDDVRLLEDWFKDWQYGSQRRSIPFYLRVLEVASTKQHIDKAHLSTDELHALVKRVQFEVENTLVESQPVVARVVIRADDPRIAEDLLETYRECLLEYVCNENVDLEERATAALRGECLARENALSKLRTELADVRLANDKREKLESSASAEKAAIGSIRHKIDVAKRTAFEYRRQIVFVTSQQSR